MSAPALLQAAQPAAPAAARGVGLSLFVVATAQLMLVLNTARQIGAAPGVVVLSAVATTVADSRVPEAIRVLQPGVVGDDAGAAAAHAAPTHGYTTGFLAGAGMLVLAAVLVFVAVTTQRTQAAAA